MNDPRLQRHELGFLEVADKPSAAELAAYYRNTYFQNEKGNYRTVYPPEELEVIGLRIEQRRAWALELLGRERPGSILDVGCGEGFVLAAFESLGWQVEGIDFSRAGVEAMNPAIADRVEDGDLFSILERRIAEGERHDLVWLANVLEHVLEPVDLLELLHRLVKPGGMLVVTVPNDGNAFHDELLESCAIADRFWIAIPDHMSYFTAESLKRTAEATGWDCRDMQADFPIDLFLAHEGSNYVRDRSKGPAAHSARLQLERLIGAAGVAAAGRFYSALADVGLGRNITAFLSPRS
ncbi:class I SAM-dependent methyltransferase [Hoeflea poritis]|uniref:Class I SAM-dependent methyltransferase n=1 Tax=Hoeflea poritis TaxID=2993659 RepID=A0ABT4VXC0_9HYPH|nr:class I SAM-dependent methyltransferase [Hoeflea poritis]MDA4848648.1 class I SAM-dependent methyltransferase [Hoeflea poritis]